MVAVRCCYFPFLVDSTTRCLGDLHHNTDNCPAQVFSEGIFQWGVSRPGTEPGLRWSFFCIGLGYCRAELYSAHQSHFHLSVLYFYFVYCFLCVECPVQSSCCRDAIKHSELSCLWGCSLCVCVCVCVCVHLKYLKM